MTANEPQIGVCHISPLRHTRGGVTTAVTHYIAATGWPVAASHIESHCDGSGWRKFVHMLRAFARALRLCQSRRIDVMHAHVGDFPSIYRKMLVTWPFFAFARCSTVLHMHGAAFLAEYDRQPAFARWLVRRFFARFDLVIALSDRWRDDLVARFAVARIMVLPNAVAVPDAALLRKRSGPCAFLFMGVIGARKGVFDLVRAARGAAARDARFTLCIAGNGDLAGLQAAIADCGLSSIVTCPGWIEGAERRATIAAADVLVLPSHAEGAPMAVIEAMASGMPIIATRVGAIPEMVEHGKSGLLVEPGDIAALGDAISLLARDRALCARMGARSFALARDRHALPVHLARLLGAYRSLVGAP